MTIRRYPPSNGQEPYSRIIQALARIVNLPAIENRFGVESTPRDPVMEEATRIRSALDDLMKFVLVAVETQPGAPGFDGAEAWNAQPASDGCPHGDKFIVRDCLHCGAPVCCGRCCAEDAQDDHDKRCPAALNLSDPCNCGAEPEGLDEWIDSLTNAYNAGQERPLEVDQARALVKAVLRRHNQLKALFLPTPAPERSAKQMSAEYLQGFADGSGKPIDSFTPCIKEMREALEDCLFHLETDMGKLHPVCVQARAALTPNAP